MRTSKASLLAIGAAAFAAAAAQADISDPGLTIEASNASGSGVYQVFLSNGQWKDNGTTWTWTSPTEGYDIFDDNFNVVAHVNYMHCTMINDPQVTVNFDVSAMSVTTHFAITTGLLTFPSGIASGAMGRATAGVAITDNDGDGATLTGGFGGSGYRANYNGTIPTGTVFSDLLPGPLVAAPFDSNGISGDSAGYPAYIPIGGAVNSMQAKFNFDLSANDSAAGTSFYEIIPAPGSVVLLGAAGMIGAARRRR